MMQPGVVLLADDNPTDAELTMRALEIGGVRSQIIWVQDGEAAVDYIFCKGAYASRNGGNPQLMLLDMHMPKIDGLEVLTLVKSDPHTRATPVVMMSSSDQASDMLHSYARYANSYIVKPVDFRQFTEQVGLIGRYWTQINRAG